MSLEKFEYDNATTQKFVIATCLWGIVGLLVGVLIAAQLAYPSMNFGEYLTYGRLRPLHTNAVIFAFVGNGIFFGYYYSFQRLCKARMFSDTLSKIHFWGWQSIIVLAAISLPLGFTQGKEYAELEWPIDILITLIWVVFGANMLGTILKRREKHMYVAIWFYIATFIAVAILHVVNSLSIPVDFFNSYSVFAGVKDALVQWWYGHNAVAFFLTTPYLGLMYYFIPKVSGRPVFSYKLSIIHFWALVFIYIWAGPHHLLYSAVPDWAQSLGAAFSIMLIAPSWGGMLNGLLTLRGAWDKVRELPSLRFMVVAVTCYGMATFEGPMMSLKSVNGLTHFTDYIIGHVHLGALGWNGFLTFGMLYWLVPKLWNTELYSKKLANAHFWLGTLGIVGYVVSMYTAGIVQGLEWKQFNADGTLTHPNFLKTVLNIIPFYQMRLIAGLLYFCGALMMAFNLIMTAASGKVQANEPAEAPAMRKGTFDTIGGALVWAKEAFLQAFFGRTTGALAKDGGEDDSHRALEAKPILFVVLTAVALLIGSLIEIVPTIMASYGNDVKPLQAPYTALQIEGREIYIREGCYNCHSQMVRPFKSEVDRYDSGAQGGYSKAGEYVYDHPFQWGSRRMGPDLHRLGGDYLDGWHYNHMLDPRSTSPGSLMPPYPWLADKEVNLSTLQKKLEVMEMLGAEYPQGYIENAEAEYRKAAEKIVKSLSETQIETAWNKEIIALIAYLQRLGKPAEDQWQ